MNGAAPGLSLLVMPLEKHGNLGGARVSKVNSSYTLVDGRDHNQNDPGVFAVRQEVLLRSTVPTQMERPIVATKHMVVVSLRRKW